MTATIAEAMAQIYAIQGDLTITSPISASIQKVWPFFPPRGAVVNETPCFLNSYSPVDIVFDSALLRTRYAVHQRLLVWDGDLDQAAAIANAFIEPIIDAYCVNIKLGLAGWSVQRLRFLEEQPRVFGPESEAAGPTFLGLDFFLDIERHSPVTFQAGDPP